MKFNNILVVESVKNTENHLSSVESIRKILDKKEANYSWINYDEISEEFFKDVDLVITIGGDGVLIRVSHFIRDTLLLGINSDSDTSEGALKEFLGNDLGFLDPVLEGSYNSTQWTRARVILNGNLVRELALNEVYVGVENQFHTSRYSICLGQDEEEHRSSGVLVSTGIGSGAWYKSAGGELFAAHEDKLKFIVREPFEGNLFKPKIISGELSAEDKITLKSKRIDGGVIAIDGSVVYPFNSGDIVEVQVSKQKLNVITPKKRVGIFGGSFNPVHNSHVKVVKNILDNKLLDEVWVVPCLSHNFGKDLVDFESRVAMLKLAFDGMPGVNICEVEKELGSVSKTYDTVCELKKRHNHDFSLVVGSDILHEINKWYKSEDLSKLVSFIVYEREGFQATVPNDLKISGIITSAVDGISSSEVRETIASGNNCDLIPEAVGNFIKEKEIYSL